MANISNTVQVVEGNYKGLREITFPSFEEFLTEEERREYAFFNSTWTTDSTNDFLIAKIELQNRDEQRLMDVPDDYIHMIYKVESLFRMIACENPETNFRN